MQEHFFSFFETYNVKLFITAIMVRTGLEKSLKNQHVLEKSLNFPHKSLNISESSLNKNNLC